MNGQTLVQSFYKSYVVFAFLSTSYRLVARKLNSLMNINLQQVALDRAQELFSTSILAVVLVVCRNEAVEGKISALFEVTCRQRKGLFSN